MCLRKSKFGLSRTLHCRFFFMSCADASFPWHFDYNHTPISTDVTFSLALALTLLFSISILFPLSLSLPLLHAHILTHTHTLSLSLSLSLPLSHRPLLNPCPHNALFPSVLFIHSHTHTHTPPFHWFPLSLSPLFSLWFSLTLPQTYHLPVSSQWVSKRALISLI